MSTANKNLLHYPISDMQFLVRLESFSIVG